MDRIHPTAVIAPTARIASGCEVGPYAVIGPQVTMAPDNVVGPHAVIEGRTTIGAGNRFSQACSIGAGPQVTGWAGEAGRLTIGDGNVFREFVTVHGATDGETVVGDRCLIMAAAHIAHDCRIGDEVKMANGATLAGHVEVGDFAWLSGLCAVHQWSRIGAHAFIAGGAIVTQDVPPFCLVQGDRARLVSLNATGLKRAGFASAEIMDLRRAYRVLFRGSGSMAERLAELEGAAGPVAELTGFLRQSSRGAISTERRAA
jgi:UDP-N-acetylglucosamine acyltransferase